MSEKTEPLAGFWSTNISDGPLFPTIGLGSDSRPCYEPARLQSNRSNTLPVSQSEPLTALRASIEDIRALSQSLITALEDDKAEDVTVIDLAGKSSLADIMILASGRSARHVGALSDHLAKKIKDKTGESPKLEGMPNADWVLIDIGDIIIHLFRPEVRAFYNLEKIWADDANAHRPSDT